MAVTVAEAGKYKQLTHRLRISRPGKPDRVSERPRNQAGEFTDGEAGTTVELLEGDAVDVAFLVQVGAVEPLLKRQERALETAMLDAGALESRGGPEPPKRGG